MARREERAYREYVSASNAASPGVPNAAAALGWRRDAPPGNYVTNHCYWTLVAAPSPRRNWSSTRSSASCRQLSVHAAHGERAGGATAPGRAVDGESRTDSTTGRWPGAAPVREGAHRGIRPGAARWARRRTHAGGTRPRL